MEFDPVQHPHRRFNPLTGEWVLVSPHRTQRPWQGQMETPILAEIPHYDPGCYLCPDNLRANGDRNPDYAEGFVFANDFAALKPEFVEAPDPDSLFRLEPVRGECRVVCYSPRHDLTLATLSVPEIAGVVRLWQVQQAELSERYVWVQIFENRGAAMGASNPHPHGQIWAMDRIPTLAERELNAQGDYLRVHGHSLLAAVAEREVQLGERVVEVNEHWVWLVPFWAVWPFEVLLLPRFAAASWADLDEAAITSLATILKHGLQRYDRLFGVPFPYSMGWHGAPSDGFPHPECQLHAHFYPPLLRSATVRKFMVGFEMLAEAQRDLTPEQAAERLRCA